MGQMCTGGRKSMLMHKHGKLNTSGANAKYSYMDTNVNILYFYAPYVDVLDHLRI